MNRQLVIALGLRLVADFELRFLGLSGQFANSSSAA